MVFNTVHATKSFFSLPGTIEGFHSTAPQCIPPSGNKYEVILIGNKDTQGISTQTWVQRPPLYGK